MVVGNVGLPHERIFRLLGRTDVLTPFDSNHEMLSGMSLP